MHLQFLRGSLVGAVCSWLSCSLLQGHGISKASFPAPIPLHPTPHLYILVFPWLHLSNWGTVCLSCVLPGDFCLPAVSVSSGKIAPCLAKGADESQTRQIHLQIMQKIAFGKVSLFIYFFSIKKQMPDSCRGSLTTVISVFVTGYHTWALWLKLGY